MKERRRSHRVTPMSDVNVILGGNRPAKLIDVSPEGAHLQLPSALNPRGECRLSLPLSDGIIRVKARVVHCKLTGFAAPGSHGQLTYHAGVEFLDVDAKLAASIKRAYPAPVDKPTRNGPIKVKIDVDALEHAVHEGGQDPN